MMTKRHKWKPELTPAQIDDLVARMTDVHKDLIPLLCELKPRSAHYNAVVDFNDALARAIRKVSGDEPIDAAPDQPLATTGTQARVASRNCGRQQACRSLQLPKLHAAKAAVRAFEDKAVSTRYLLKQRADDATQFTEASN